MYIIVNSSRYCMRRVTADARLSMRREGATAAAADVALRALMSCVWARRMHHPSPPVCDVRRPRLALIPKELLSRAVIVRSLRQRGLLSQCELFQAAGTKKVKDCYSQVNNTLGFWRGIRVCFSDFRGESII